MTIYLMLETLEVPLVRTYYKWINGNIYTEYMSANFKTPNEKHLLISHVPKIKRSKKKPTINIERQKQTKLVPHIFDFMNLYWNEFL